MDWDQALQIGQLECGLTIAPVGGAKQREERLILIYGQCYNAQPLGA
jgi:hypothetical protein